MAFGGGGIALKSLSFFFRLIEFLCAAIILGVFSYYLAALNNHDLPISTSIRAVEGIAGIAVLYTIFGLLLVCCLGGISFLGFFAMFLDLLFAGAFAYVAYATRGGASSCTGIVNTPFGSGNTETENAVPNGKGGFTNLPSLRAACQLEKASFAVAIIGGLFFLLSIPLSLALVKHHRKERAFGPSPNNGYTAGSPKRKFWQRKPRRDAEYGEKVNPNALPPHATPSDFRDSYATETTAVGGEAPLNKYGNSAPYGNAGATHQHGYAGDVLGSGAHGYQTTTTTHVPHDGYLRSTPNRNSNPTGTF